MRATENKFEVTVVLNNFAIYNENSNLIFGNETMIILLVLAELWDSRNRFNIYKILKKNLPKIEAEKVAEQNPNRIRVENQWFDLSQKPTPKINSLQFEVQ